MLRIFKSLRLGHNELLAALGLLIVCLSPVAYKEYLGEAASISRMLSSALYALPLCFILLSIKKRYVFIVLSFIVMLSSIAETLMVVMYKNFITAGNILAVITTTSDEGSGFLSTATHTLPYYIPLITGYTIAVIYHKKINKNRKCLIYSAALVILSIAFVAYQLQVKWQGRHTTYFYVKQNILCRPPFNFYFQSVGAAIQMKYKSYISEAEKMTFGAERHETKNKEIYVLAIGESLRYNNISLAGYERETTPNLDTIKNVVLYTDYYSTATLTMYSVPQILTRATPHDFVLNYKEKSIYKPFAECGFKTFAICCDNLLTYEKYLTNGTDGLYSVKEDSDIANVIDSISQKHDKTFFIVQFWGNHGPYENFRTKDNVFIPNPVYDNVSWNDEEAKKNAYDNTVRYTDYNVSNIIKAINKPNTLAAFLMISDHGEDLHPDSGGHGGTSNPSKDEFHVPFIFWHSDLWKECNEDKYEQLLKNKNKPINADNVFYSVCDMAGINIAPAYAKPEWSVLSTSFTIHPRFLLLPDGENIMELK